MIKRGEAVRVIIIAGPNGAGKSTFVEMQIPEPGLFYSLNADEIEKRQALTHLGAGKEMLRLLDQHIVQSDDVLVETTLSGNTYNKRIPAWRALGYSITLYYLQLPNVETAIRRVQQRVASGGHHIPETTIRQRFVRSRKNSKKPKNISSMNGTLLKIQKLFFGVQTRDD